MKTILLLFILLCPVDAWATWHIYLMPYSILTVDGIASYSPDFDDTGVAGTLTNSIKTFNTFRYGGQPWALVAANVDDATDALLVAKTNIRKIPDNLDQQVGSGAPLTTVQNILENRLIPGAWVTAVTTYRTILRVVMGASIVLQRYRAISGNFGPIFTGGVTLDTTFGSLPLAARNNLIATATALSLDTSGITGGSTLRQILKAIGDQFAGTPFTLGGITI